MRASIAWKSLGRCVCSSQVFLSATKPNLHTQDIPHSLGGFLLRRCGDMGIGVQSEASGEVAQHAGDCLDVHTVLERNGGEGVAEVMESDLRDSIFKSPREIQFFDFPGFAPLRH
jgi:hypothetical protein